MPTATATSDSDIAGGARAADGGGKARPGHTAFLLFKDLSQSSDSAAYPSGIKEIKSFLETHAVPGDGIFVYAIQENTAAEPVRYKVFLPPDALSTTELAELRGGGPTRQRAIAKREREFRNVRDQSIGHLIRLGRSAGIMSNWTDIYGAFDLARERQLAGAKTVHLLVCSDMEQSTRTFDLDRVNLPNEAAATRAGEKQGKAWRTEMPAGLRPDDVHLHVYFPETQHSAKNRSERMRDFWRAFAKEAGLGGLDFAA